jgi:hypothetical protein
MRKKCKNDINTALKENYLYGNDVLRLLENKIVKEIFGAELRSKKKMLQETV